ncbi:MAG: helix-turn-helix transcriptional regulator [Elusimicrobia bacterium]|nr:helix-turn-helix transcriptional regulator [Elusimicrobiota bacterium]
MSTEPLPFADLVRSRMLERGVGLRELCREAGLDASFFSKVLAGKRSPPAEESVLRRLAGSLGLDAARLVVAAGRIPGEWRGLWTDPALFEAVDGVLRGRTGAPGPSRPSSWDSPAPFSRPAVRLEDELL